MNDKDIQSLLATHGFPVGAVDGVIGPATKSAISRFQKATTYYSGPIDSVAGPNTQAALSRLPNLSDHFVVDELRSHGNGDCYVRKELVNALEQLRARLNMPIHVIDAYRDPKHNAEVGGVSGSQHLDGLAADIPGICGWRVVAAMQVFSGLGDRLGAISHVDMRHINGGPSTPTNPARWTY